MDIQLALLLQVHWLPPDTEEKLSLSMNVLLAGTLAAAWHGGETLIEYECAARIRCVLIRCQRLDAWFLWQHTYRR